MHRFFAFCLVISFSTGCAGTFDVTGGPQSVRLAVDKAAILAQLRPLVAEDPEAVRAVESVARRERNGKILLYSELALVGGCIGISVADQYSGGPLTWTGAGFCVGGIALGIAAIIVLPGMKTYGEPLRVYNRNHPGTPFLAPQVGVR